MTIAATPTRAQIKTGEMYGGGMAERARILKSSLTNIFPLIEKQNVLLVLLNQVMAEIGGWKPGVTSAGGNALKHDVHMRLEINGGKTQYDGVYAVSKYSTLSVRKSKVSPVMNDFHIIIDITKGGVIDRAGSFVWWMTSVNPSIFKQSSWWSIEDWVYQKYKVYWDKFPDLCGKFRQAKLYEFADKNPDFVDFLQLIWVDLVSEKYALQREVCASLRDKLESKLMLNLGLTYEDVYPPESQQEEIQEIETEVSEETLGELSDILNVDTDTGEVIE